MQGFSLFAVPGLPMIQPGDDLPALIVAGLASAGEQLLPGDVLVIAQKIISKAEGRLVRLADVVPDERSKAVAAVVADAFGQPRLEGRKFQVRTVGRDQLAQLRQSQLSVDQDHVLRLGLQAFEDEVPQGKLQRALRSDRDYIPELAVL